MLTVILEAFRSAVLISGLVVVMMMLIESFNVESSGRLFSGLKKSGFAQVVVAALLGSVPGCVGGFAAVSLYTHRLLSFGALLAMMIATAGDESFMMLAMFPSKAAWLLLTLFVLAVIVGLVADRVGKGRKPIPTRLEDSYDLHEGVCVHADEDHDHHHENDSDSHEAADHEHSHEEHHGRHFSWRRVAMFLGVAVFIAALLSGLLEEENGGLEQDGLNLLSEEWMYWLFGGLSLIVLAALIFGSDHFVEEHLWEHIVCRHLPSIFAWTFGVLLIIGTLFHFVDLSTWISDNTALMILLAILIGLIPESGPHMIFVTLFATGVIPFPVLLANSIVQDGHASLPLLADSKASFVRAKLIKAALAALVSFLWIIL